MPRAKIITVPIEADYQSKIFVIFTNSDNMGEIDQNAPQYDGI